MPVNDISRLRDRGLLLRSEATVTKKAEDLKTAVAYHEAGHAVAAVMLELAVRRVTIIQDEEAYGRVSRRSPPLHVMDALETGDMWQHPDAFVRGVSEIIMAMSGGIAGLRGTGANLDWESPEFAADEEVWLAWAEQMTVSNVFEDARERDALLGWLRTRAEVLLNQNWSAVEAVATKLLQRRTLTGSQVTKIVNEAILERRLSSLPPAERREAKKNLRAFMRGVRLNASQRP